MKKIFYLGVIALIAAIIGGCSVDDGARKETKPNVTVYSLKIPAAADEDKEVVLRVIPNSLCNSFYILEEKKSEKDKFIDEEGEKAYIQRVIDNGRFETLESFDPKTDTIWYKNCAGIYSITAVSVGNGAKKGDLVEFVFNGKDWIDAGKVTIKNSDWFFGAIDRSGVVVEKDAESDLYRLKPIFEISGSNSEDKEEEFRFVIDKKNEDGTYKVTFPKGTASGTNINVKSGLYYKFDDPKSKLDDETVQDPDNPINPKQLNEEVSLRIDPKKSFYSESPKKLVLHVAPVCATLGVIKKEGLDPKASGFFDMTFTFE